MSDKCAGGVRLTNDPCKRCGATTSDTCPVSLQKASDAFDGMLEALREVDEFLEGQAEAEYFPDRASPVPNRAMQLLVEIREAIAKAEGAK